mgnify:CR=1 FL=1
MNAGRGWVAVCGRDDRGSALRVGANCDRAPSGLAAHGFPLQLEAMGVVDEAVGRRVLYTRTTDLVQKLQAARRDLILEQALARLDRFDLVILDDIAYAQKDQSETSVIFELIARRYENRSLAIAANVPFSAWDRLFPDKAMAVAAIVRGGRRRDNHVQRAARLAGRRSVRHQARPLQRGTLVEGKDPAGEEGLRPLRPREPSLQLAPVPPRRLLQDATGISTSVSAEMCSASSGCAPSHVTSAGEGRGFTASLTTLVSMR